MAENGINLLPEELRKAEARERKRPVPPPAPAGYSAPVSEFEERLRGLTSAAPRRSLWQRVKDWFTTVPAPVAPPDRVALPPPPGRAPAAAAPPVVRGPAKAPSMPAAPPLASTVVARPVPPPPAAAPVAQPSASPRGSRAQAKAAPPIPLGMLLDVNLLPSEALLPGLRPTVKLMVVAGIGILLVGITYAVVSSLVVQRTNQLASAQNTAHELAQQARQLHTQLAEVQNAGEKMNVVTALLASRPDWEKFFTTLESLTLPTVNYLNASVSVGEVALSAQAPTIKDLARQLLVFQQSSDVVAKVVMGSIAASEAHGNERGVVRTTFQLEVVPGWLATAAPAQP